MRISCRPKAVERECCREKAERAGEDLTELISKLTGEQAIDVLCRLTKERGTIAEAILDEARRVLATVDIDEIADQLFFQLDMIDVQDCWDRSAATRDGYVSAEDAAMELIEEELQPFHDQMKRYRELMMDKQERDYCMGIILGLYRYEQESKSEFKDWCEDLPLSCAGSTLDDWREQNGIPAASVAMNGFFQQRCPKWAVHLMVVSKV